MSAIKLGFQTLPLGFMRHKNWLNTEMRTMLNKKKVQQYAHEKKTGSHFPAPVVFIGPDGVYRTGDGFHRIEADHLNGEARIEVVVKAGTVKDAILFNLKANRENQGLAFAPGDITKSIKRLLTDKLFEKWTRFQVAEAVGCSYGMVSRVALHHLGLPKHKSGRRPVVDTEYVVQQLAEGRTYTQIADELGVSRTCLTNAQLKDRFEECPYCHGSGKVLKKIPSQVA